MANVFMRLCIRPLEAWDHCEYAVIPLFPYRGPNRVTYTSLRSAAESALESGFRRLLSLHNVHWVFVEGTPLYGNDDITVVVAASAGPASMAKEAVASFFK